MRPHLFLPILSILHVFQPFILSRHFDRLLLYRPGFIWLILFSSTRFQFKSIILLIPAQKKRQTTRITSTKAERKKKETESQYDLPHKKKWVSRLYLFVNRHLPISKTCKTKSTMLNWRRCANYRVLWRSSMRRDNRFLIEFSLCLENRRWSRRSHWTQMHAISCVMRGNIVNWG